MKEPALARQYGLNQTSISRAIALLEAEGLVRTEHGRGCYVVDVPKVKRVRHIPPQGGADGSAFAEGVGKAGMQARTELVHVGTVDPPERVAHLLGLTHGSQVLLRKRQMFADERPLQLAASHIPLDVAGGVDIAHPDTGPTGMYRRLAARGHAVERFAEEIESRRPTPEEQEFLRISHAQQVLEVTRLAYGRTGRVLEATTNVFPSQLWRLSYEWKAEPDPDLPTHSVSVTGIVVGTMTTGGCYPAECWRWAKRRSQGLRARCSKTGLTVEPVRLVGVYKNMRLGVVSLAIRCRPVDGVATPSDEAASVSWLSEREALELMPPARAVRVSDAFRDDGPFVRIHDGHDVIDDVQPGS